MSIYCNYTGPNRSSILKVTWGSWGVSWPCAATALVVEPHHPSGFSGEEKKGVRDAVMDERPEEPPHSRGPLHRLLPGALLVPAPGVGFQDLEVDAELQFVPLPDEECCGLVELRNREALVVLVDHGTDHRFPFDFDGLLICCPNEDEPPEKVKVVPCWVRDDSLDERDLAFFCLPGVRHGSQYTGCRPP
jgi:hypothetical protein